MKVAVEDLQEGMFVDLEANPFNVCDVPGCTIHGLEGVYDYEYAVVEGIEQETPECVRVDFEGDSIGFPTGYQVDVEGQL
jgi:hypothetical protein